MTDTTQTDVEVSDVNSAANLFSQQMSEEVTDETQETNEETQETNEETDEETQEVVTDDDDDKPPKETEDQITTLSQLGEHLGVDREILNTIKVPTKVDGIEGESTIGEMIESFQTQQHVTNKSKEVSELRRQLEEQQQAYESSYVEKLREAGELVSVLEAGITGDYGKIDWDELRETDPGEFAAKKSEFNERANQLAQVKNTVSQNYNAVNQEQVTKQLAVEAKRLLEAIPEWADEAVKKTEMKEIAEYLVACGVPEAQVNTITNHHVVLFARNSMLLERMNKTAKPKKKKLKALPKVGSGRATTKADKNVQASKAVTSRFNKDPSVTNAAAMFKDMMLNSGE